MVESDQQHILGAWTQQHLIFESHGHQVVELSTTHGTDEVIKADQKLSRATVERQPWACLSSGGHPSQSASDDARGQCW